MATLEQIVYNIAENAGREHDQPLLERLRFMVPYYRSFFLRRDEAKGRKVDPQFLQVLEKVEMEEVDRSMIMSIAEVECPLLRSKFRIPVPMRFLSGPAIRIVTTMDNNRVITPVEFEAIRFLQANRFTGREPRYYYRNGYLWLINSNAEVITLEMVAEDPYEAYLFNDPDADLFEMDYPMSSDFIKMITEYILKTELSIGPADPTNDDVTLNE